MLRQIQKKVDKQFLCQVVFIPIESVHNGPTADDCEMFCDRQQQNDYTDDAFDHTASFHSVEEVNPYPLSTTYEEMEDIRVLNSLLGDEWSLDLADDLSTSDASDWTAEGNQCPTHEFVWDTSGSHNNDSTERYDSTLDGESTDVRALRNQLWKASLKRSLFRGD